MTCAILQSSMTGSQLYSILLRASYFNTCAERPRLVQTQCWCPQGTVGCRAIVVYAANLF
eukprot:scaffold5485_cov55-Phaeocystis_antarctica.AAC.3